jgi:hypothetical protein
LVMGIAGLIIPLIGIGAIVTGIMALNDFKEEPNRYKGKGMANAGIVLGSIATIFMVIMIVFYVLFFAWLFRL